MLAILISQIMHGITAEVSHFASLLLTELPLSVCDENIPELVHHLEHLWASLKPSLPCLGSSATAHEVEVYSSTISERFGQGQCFTPKQRSTGSRDIAST